MIEDSRNNMEQAPYGAEKIETIISEIMGVSPNDMDLFGRVLRNPEMYDPNEIYDWLKNGPLRPKTRRELASTSVVESGQPMESVSSEGSVEVRQIDPVTGQLESSGSIIRVRQDIVPMLSSAAATVRSTFGDDFKLLLAYGYRDPNVQQTSFDRVMRTLSGFEDIEARKDEAHIWIADPEVAGHPTGGAVDVGIINNNGEIIDFGSPFWDFSTADCMKFSPFVGVEALQNRLLLDFCMTTAGFSRYPGEFWHFSFGDREWAATENIDFAVYGPVEDI